MILSPESQINNSSLLTGGELNKNMDCACGLVDAIEVNRPLRDVNEAGVTVEVLNRVLAFVEYGLSDHTSNPQAQQEDVMEGAADIINACRLLSLRMEQYIDMHVHENGNQGQRKGYRNHLKNP